MFGEKLNTMTLREHIKSQMQIETIPEILQIIGDDVADKTEEETIAYLKLARDEVSEILSKLIKDTSTLIRAREAITNEVLEIIDKTDINILKRKVYGTRN